MPLPAMRLLPHLAALTCLHFWRLSRTGATQAAFENLDVRQPLGEKPGQVFRVGQLLALLDRHVAADHDVSANLGEARPAVSKASVRDGSLQEELRTPHAEARLGFRVRARV